MKISPEKSLAASTPHKSIRGFVGSAGWRTSGSWRRHGRSSFSLVTIPMRLARSTSTFLSRLRTAAAGTRFPWATCASSPMNPWPMFRASPPYRRFDCKGRSGSFHLRISSESDRPWSSPVSSDQASSHGYSLSACSMPRVRSQAAQRRHVRGRCPRVPIGPLPRTTFQPGVLRRGGFHTFEAPTQ